MNHYSFTFGTFTKDKFLNGINYIIMTREEFNNCTILQNFMKKTFVGSIVKAEDIHNDFVLVDIPYAAYTDPDVLTGIIHNTKLTYHQAIKMYEGARYYKKQELAEFIKDELKQYKGKSKGYLNLALYNGKKGLDGFTSFSLDLSGLRAVLKDTYRIKSFSITKQFIPECMYLRVYVNAQLRVRRNTKVSVPR